MRSLEACPQEFSIEAPTIIRDYGYSKGSAATTALGERTRAEWISILPTYDVLNRYCLTLTLTLTLALAPALAQP